jgi:hypothetical protein
LALWLPLQGLSCNEKKTRQRFPKPQVTGSIPAVKLLVVRGNDL